MRSRQPTCTNSCARPCRALHEIKVQHHAAASERLQRACGCSRVLQVHAHGDREQARERRSLADRFAGRDLGRDRGRRYVYRIGKCVRSTHGAGWPVPWAPRGARKARLLLQRARWMPIRDGVSRGQTSATYNCTSSSFRARTLAERYQ